MGLFCGGVVVVICGLDQSKERIVAMLDGQFNEKEQQAAGDFGRTRELREAAPVAQQECIPAGCSKSPSSKAATDESTGGVASGLR